MQQLVEIRAIVRTEMLDRVVHCLKEAVGTDCARRMCIRLGVVRIAMWPTQIRTTVA